MKGNIIYVNERITMKALRGGQAFGTDSYLLAAYAGKTELDAVELGSGIGVCSLLLADRSKAKHIYAVEIQKELHDVAVDNFINNKMPVPIEAPNCDLRDLDASKFHAPVGMVIANPPYFKKGSGIQSPIPSKNAARFELNGGISAGSFADLAAHSGQFIQRSAGISNHAVEFLGLNGAVIALVVDHGLKGGGKLLVQVYNDLTGAKAAEADARGAQMRFIRPLKGAFLQAFLRILFPEVAALDAFC